MNKETAHSMNFEKTKVETLNSDIASITIEAPEQHKELVNFIKNSFTLKPEGLYMEELNWKYLVRSVVRGKNILLVGPSGCGKTLAAQSIQKAFGRPSFYFNMGATQDPRSTLIGNTHFKKEEGTLFSESHFVHAIRTPNSIILLDELTRAHPDAWNILMTPLDYKQRYLRLDEKNDCETVPVANGVTFIATANIGNEYTATRVLDRALKDRFIIIEVPTLTKEQEFGLLKYLYPDVNVNLLEKVAAFAAHTRLDIHKEDTKLTTIISTRMSVEMAGLIYDGFKFIDAASVAIFPFYSVEGGNDSERTHIKQIAQKFDIIDEKIDDADAGVKLFSNTEVDNAFDS